MRTEDRRHLSSQLVAVREAHGPDTSGIPHQLFQHGVPSLVGLLVSETPLKETCKRRDVVKVGVLKLTIGRDGVSPHQIPHTEIIKSFVKGEAGHGTFKDMLRGGIGFTAVPAIVPRAGGSPPNVGIGVDAALGSNKRTIILRDVGIVTLVLMSIGLGAVVRHVVVGK